MGGGGVIRVNRSLDSTGKLYCGLLEFLTTLLKSICEVRPRCWTRRPGSQTTPVIGRYTCGHRCSDRCPNTFGVIVYFPLKKPPLAPAPWTEIAKEARCVLHRGSSGNPHVQTLSFPPGLLPDQRIFSRPAAPHDHNEGTFVRFSPRDSESKVRCLPS